MQKELEKQIARMVYCVKFYDEHKVLPFKKKRIDVSLSYESLEKLEGKNRSKFIEELITTS